mgnify:CR=1 FL=1
MKYRHELKFLVSDRELEILRYRLKALMEQDRHQRGDSYRIRSLYFDDFRDSYLQENEDGVDQRKKYRIRIYDGEDTIIKLEKKSKVRTMTSKEGVLLSKEETQLYMKGQAPAIKDDDSFLKKEFFAQIKANGRLRITNIGGMNANNAEAENVRVYTRDGKVYEGTFQLCNPSKHCNAAYSDINRNWDTCELVLDEDVNSVEDVRALGIEVGDIVCFDPRTRRTASGYLKSRFLDDKLSVGILLGFAKYLADNKIELPRRTYVHVTVFEEVGHGASCAVPAGVTEFICVDMGCVGDGLNCTEKQVSIAVKDSSGPYHYDVITKLINAAKATGADYAVDVYPLYTSDVDAAVRAGYDVRHGLIGPGVYASHGYERSHIDGVLNSIKVLAGYQGV